VKRKGYKIILVWILVLADLAAAAVLAVGVNMGMKSGYSSEMWEDILRGRSWLESAQYEQLAADAVFDALEVAARNSRLERGGAYDPERIIRIRDYLDSRIVYDMVQEEQKKDGICYKLGDLYQWSLKGTNVQQNIFQESYKPLFYNSIQEYANECDEEYNVVVSQIVEAMEVLRKDVAEYQQIKKAWSYEAVNVRFALWDLGSGNVYTNVQELQKTELKQENLEQYFYGMGSYYSFDSRSANVVQKNVGDYYSYNTHALLTGWNAHLMGEYQVYVGIDTGFPVADQFAKGALAYETAKDRVERYAIASAVGALILLCTILGLFWRLSGYVSRLLTEVFAHAGMAVQAGVLFMGYELIQLPLGLLFGKGAVAALVLFLYKLMALGLIIWSAVQRQKLLDGVEALAAGETEGDIPRISTEYFSSGNRRMAEAVNNLGEGLRNALQEQMKSERMKAALITNVSHDLKTPLTSIINYVDLMKREEIENPQTQEYLQVLDQKSQRLKQLTEDLVEASRASSGNVVLDITRLDLKELLMQIGGEYEERLSRKGLVLVADYPQDPLYVEADGRKLWRIIENLYRNVEKYALSGTRVYVELSENGAWACMSMKNISEQPLNISAEELTERFTRGDESRSTEGSGLGLSIARDLTELQKGTFAIHLDGDLFKAVLTFPKLPAENAAGENV